MAIKTTVSQALVAITECDWCGRECCRHSENGAIACAADLNEGRARRHHQAVVLIENFSFGVDLSEKHELCDDCFKLFLREFASFKKGVKANDL